MKPQRPQIARAVLRKKNNAEDTTLPDLKLPYNNQHSVMWASKTDTWINGTEKRTQK